MTPEEAAWIREHVWTPAMRKTHRDVPGLLGTCPCQWGPTSWCQHGDCDRCRRGVPLPSPAGYVCGRDGETPLALAQPYEHRAPSATGRHQTSLALFWYADRICAWRCPHECHNGIGQGALFNLAVSA